MTLAELKALAEKATPGPWQGYEGGAWGDGSFGVALNGDKTGDWFRCDTINENGGNNAKYIASANPAVVLDLLERLEAMEKALDNSVKVIQRRFANTAYWSLLTDAISRHGSQVPLGNKR